MYVKWKETFSFDLTVNCISSPASWATQGHQPYTLFDSNKDTVSTLLLALPSSYEGICCRLHLLALLAGLGIRFRFSSNWPGKKTTRSGWNLTALSNVSYLSSIISNSFVSLESTRYQGETTQLTASANLPSSQVKFPTENEQES